MRGSVDTAISAIQHSSGLKEGDEFVLVKKNQNVNEISIVEQPNVNKTPQAVKNVNFSRLSGATPNSTKYGKNDPHLKEAKRKLFDSIEDLEQMINTEPKSF
jgi:hypothetical protein